MVFSCFCLYEFFCYIKKQKFDPIGNNFVNQGQCSTSILRWKQHPFCIQKKCDVQKNKKTNICPPGNNFVNQIPNCTSIPRWKQLSFFRTKVRCYFLNLNIQIWPSSLHILHFPNSMFVARRDPFCVFIKKVVVCLFCFLICCFF